MAKLRPTVAEVKAELRLPPNGDIDDALIEGYIGGVATSVYADLHWIKGQTQEITIKLCDLSSKPFRLQIRGIDPVVTSRFVFAFPVPFDVTLEAVGAYINNTISPNRYISYLAPRKDWNDVRTRLLEAAGQEALNYPFNLRLHAADAPELILSAMRKLSVDCYHHNGVAASPMRTAVERMLIPIQDD